MLRREPKLPPEYIYPVDDWRFIQKRFNLQTLPQDETIFSVANGYVGLRGTFDEGRPVSLPGTYVNGFYDSWPIVYGEAAYGFARTGQTIVNVPDARIIRLYVDDEPLFLPTARLVHFRRTLDMQAGTLDRELLWETPSGKQVQVNSRRFVSFEHRHVAAISYEVTIRNATAPIIISSEVVNEFTPPDPEGDPRQARGFRESPLVALKQQQADWRTILGYRTRNSGMTLSCGVDHVIDTECHVESETTYDEDHGKVAFIVDAQAGKPVRITKYMAYHTSRSAPVSELMNRSNWSLDRAMRHGFDSLLESQRAYLDEFWQHADVQVEGGHPRLQQSIRWNLFQLVQATGRVEGTGVPAKGLTGQAYEGHYFWDTEIYVLPFLVYTTPSIAKNLLRFRHSLLDKARERAREVDQKGAMFPWRTINGEEASAYYAAGTAQYHINADIMYGLRKYVEATGDDDFLWDYGAEMLIETGRMWYDLGFFSSRRNGQFCIDGVTGPDEYTTVVNNNLFTNMMARHNLRYAHQIIRRMKREAPNAYTALAHRVRLRESEPSDWLRAADRMFTPYDEEMGIHPQDDSFLYREAWDLKKTPPEKYPLLLFYHPLTIYRRQVIKQADVVLAMFLLGRDFSPEQKRRNFDYYDPLTTGDSSLSACIQSIVASEIHDDKKASRYFIYAVLMDLADVGGNVKDGAHIASAGGTWMALIYGFAGMRDYDGHLSFAPRLPERWRTLRFRLAVRGRHLQVELNTETASYRLLSGEPFVITHQGQDISLRAGEPVTVPILSAESSDVPAAPAVGSAAGRQLH